MQNFITNTDQYTMWEESGFLCCRFKTDKITFELAKETVKVRTSIFGDNPVCLFADVSNVKSVTKEARDYMASGEASGHIKAAAIMANSMVSWLMGNFFVAYNKPPINIRIFRSEKEAKEWLKLHC